jgi:uncharacterized protein (TIGR03663 family)
MKNGSCFTVGVDSMHDTGPFCCATKDSGVLEEHAHNGGRDLSGRAWWIGTLLIVGLAIALRTYHLELSPLHQDEAVNGNFVLLLAGEGEYKYNPAYFHGPTLYYFSLIPAYALGLTDFAIRCVPALFGIMTVLLVLSFRSQIGDMGALAAAALLAVSPGAVYLSRYFIHETLFVFFTLALVHATLRWYQTRHIIFLILAASWAALLFATKETAIIAAGVLCIALALTTASGCFVLAKSCKRRTRNCLNQAQGSGSAPPHGAPSTQWLLDGGTESLCSISQTRRQRYLLLSRVFIAVTTFLILTVAIYSSFFSNWPQGVYDIPRSWNAWAKIGWQAQVHPWWKHVQWLWQGEPNLLILGFIGAWVTVLQQKSLFAFFVTLWAWGMLAAYSCVPYKTPWLLLNCVIPLSIVAGYGLQEIYICARDRGHRALSTLAWTVVFIAIVVSLVQAISFNFVYYDDHQKTPYAYRHTSREIFVLLDQVHRLAQSTGQGELADIAVVSPEYWPLPWYLRSYKRVGYFGRMVDCDETIVIGDSRQDPELSKTLGDRYRRVNSRLRPNGSYKLRPHTNLVIYARNNLRLGLP